MTQNIDTQNDELPKISNLPSNLKQSLREEKSEKKLREEKFESFLIFCSLFDFLPAQFSFLILFSNICIFLNVFT
ncbi:unnamed protein product [Meloidogyne enterolobii]|uniref:Uncharacterized protein n=1 Tax=Meloidogyne enterolobii TaxID=390850 RepID=A0ACB0ZMV3_MELEN